MMQNGDLVIGLDLGGTKLAAAMFRKEAAGGLSFVRALENRKYDTIFGNAKNLKAKEKSERIEAAMAEAVRELAGPGQGAVGAIGICSAGFVEDGVMVEAYNIGMKNTPLRDNIASQTGVKTYLYKDSWAPAFVLRADKPAMVFSIGTGFGGVSCEPDMGIPLKSFTQARKPIWIPFLYANDDPGYAVAFSDALSAELFARGMARANAGLLKGNPAATDGGRAREWARKLKEKAKREKRLTLSPLMLAAAKLFARPAVERWRSNEVYADVPGAATFPPFIFSLLTGREIAPPELDALIAAADPNAVIAFHAQAEFIAYILFCIQKERIDNGLKPAELVFATGSGYNPATHKILSRPIAESLNEFCAAAKIPGVRTGAVEYLEVPGGAPTTLACFGAAMGAARGI
jgi:hypothetical protein